MTVYGREPRRLHPGVLALAVSAAIIVVVAVAYWVLRPSADTPEPITPAAAAPVAAAVSPSPELPSLRTGKWQLALAGDPQTVLTADGEFAAMSGDDPMTLAVVAGLADESCFTFRNPDGDYLRHFDYRLRFDGKDDSELFRKDATFCIEQETTAGFRLSSKNYPAHVLHRRDGELYIDKPDGSGEFTTDSTFVIQKPAG
ncbi:AbfB domain-containing protein [Actinoplanes sp. NBC_00393]|uniref:AbfB domain-containing protein n=1 Tax=Actinoplanes sp. NBC_00393 TaxID=2975953 RepID=UPI002E1EB4DE